MITLSIQLPKRLLRQPKDSRKRMPPMKPNIDNHIPEHRTRRDGNPDRVPDGARPSSPAETKIARFEAFDGDPR
jgi:hypothetical protein